MTNQVSTRSVTAGTTEAMASPLGFAELVQQQMPRLLAAARQLLRDREAAHDVVQDALLAAVRALPKFQRRAALATWLHRIVINAALMHLRRTRRRPAASIEDLQCRFTPEGAHIDPPLPWHIEPCAVERAETRAMVRAAIEELPPGQRNVLELRDIEGLDTGQAADLMGVSANAVKIRLHRARNALRGLLEPRLDATRPRPIRVDLATRRTADHVISLAPHRARPGRPQRRVAGAPRSAA